MSEEKCSIDVENIFHDVDFLDNDYEDIIYEISFQPFMENIETSQKDSLLNLLKKLYKNLDGNDILQYESSNFQFLFQSSLFDSITETSKNAFLKNFEIIKEKESAGIIQILNAKYSKNGKCLECTYKNKECVHQHQTRICKFDCQHTKLNLNKKLCCCDSKYGFYCKFCGKITNITDNNKFIKHVEEFHKN